MFESFRNWLSSTAGKIVVIVLLVPLVCGAVYSVMSFSRGSGPDFAGSTMYICTETGKTFRHRNQAGETLPIYSSFSGKNTAVPAEPCYWTRDGGTKTEPTWVLVNEFVHKPGPTFCPDCGRLVIGHNPRPGPGVRPPPTQEEWNLRMGPHRSSQSSHDDARQ
jgi:hypothetical protein